MKVLPVAGLMVVASACVCRPQRDEPTDTQLRSLLDTHQPQLDELRKLFDDDVKRVQLRVISASSAEDSWCQNGTRSLTCLDTDRWRQYATGMKSTGILRIERHETPGVYFQVYRNPYWTNCFRFRGIVYAPGFSTVVHNHDDTEERVELRDGWFSYLIIDT